MRFESFLWIIDKNSLPRIFDRNICRNHEKTALERCTGLVNIIDGKSGNRECIDKNKTHDRPQ